MAAVAQVSKDKILTQVEASTAVLEDVLAASIYNSVLAIAVVIVILMITLIIISLVLLIYLGIISTSKAIAAFVIASVYILVIAVIFVRFTYEYSLNKARNAGAVFNNYVASEKAIETVYNAAVIYKQVAGI